MKPLLALLVFLVVGCGGRTNEERISTLISKAAIQDSLYEVLELKAYSMGKYCTLTAYATLETRRLKTGQDFTAYELEDFADSLITHYVPEYKRGRYRR
jgi:hypothetical protein